MSSVAPPRCAKPSVRSTLQPLLVALLPVALARGDHALGDHVHRRLELELLPLGAVRAAVAGPSCSRPGLLDQLARGRALRAQRALVDRRARVALDVDQLAVARVDELAAADGAVRADGLRDLQAGDPRAGLLGLARGGERPEAPVGGAADDGQLAQALEARGRLTVAGRSGSRARLPVRSRGGVLPLAGADVLPAVLLLSQRDRIGDQEHAG